MTKRDGKGNYKKDFTGTNRQKTKRGFATKHEAQDWERAFKLQQDQNMDMFFEDFVEIYTNDKKPRVKLNTWMSKQHIIDTKILPYFGKKKLSEIRTSDILSWQNEIMKKRKDDGTQYSQTYLKTIHNQLSAILNHAVNMYGLRVNVARRAGDMGKEQSKEILYWCGIRLGELLALTPADFNFETHTLSINKSYQKLAGKDVITDPKTPKSNRRIIMPEFLSIEVDDYIKRLYGIPKRDRIFQLSKSFLHHEMDRGVALSGVKRIRIHDLRHSHVSLLINMGFSALAIGDRVGHEAIDITYKYVHLFPTVQTDMAEQLNIERTALLNHKIADTEQKGDESDVGKEKR